MALRKLLPRPGECIPRRADRQSGACCHLRIIEKVAPVERDQVIDAGPHGGNHNRYICRMRNNAVMSMHISCRWIPHDLQPRSAQRLPVVR